MRKLLIAAGLLALATSAAEAHHKPGHHIPPGLAKKRLPADVVIVVPPPEVAQVCLVTTARAGDLLAPVVVTAWLPRDIAERRAATGDSFIVYHPDLNTRDGCLGYGSVG